MQHVVVVISAIPRRVGSVYVRLQACSMESAKRPKSQEYTFEFVRIDGKRISVCFSNSLDVLPLRCQFPYRHCVARLSSVCNTTPIKTPYGIAFAMEHVDRAALKSATTQPWLHQTVLMNFHVCAFVLADGTTGQDAHGLLRTAKRVIRKSPQHAQSELREQCKEICRAEHPGVCRSSC